MLGIGSSCIEASDRHSALFYIQEAAVEELLARVP